MSFSLQWYRDGIPIPGAVNGSYKVTKADQGHTLTFGVTATNAAGSSTAVSAGVSVPPPTPDPPPTLVVSGAPATTWTAGVAYSFTPNVTGGTSPYAFTIKNKPSWATFNTSTGQLSGTPPAAGTFSGVQINVADAGSPVQTGQLGPWSIAVAAAPSLITTTAQLAAALSTATGGQTLLLASGPFDALQLSGINPASQVTIVANDHANPPVFAGMEMDNCSNLLFQYLIIRLEARTQAVCNVTHSNHISFDHCDLGDAPGSQNGNLLFRWCSYCSVTNSNLHDSGTFIRGVTSDHITLQYNFFHDAQGDGVQFTSTNQVTVDKNTFTNFNPSPGDHPDAIQFFTFGQTAPTTDISITRNLITRGAGKTIQGIFLGNEANQPYQNVTITGNGMAGTMYNGIALGMGQNATVSNNYVQPYVDQDSYIVIDTGTNVTANGNYTRIVNQIGTNTNVTVTNTHVISATAVGDNAAMLAWYNSQ